MNTRATVLLGIDQPIVLAPMAGVATPKLAAAVSNAGGLGSIGMGASTPRKASEMISQTQALTDRPFNVNLFCHRPATADAAKERAWLEHLAPFFAEFGATPPERLSELYRSFVHDPEMLDVLLEQRPAVVSFHFGLPPAEYIRALKQAGIVLLASATSSEEGRRIEQAGIDGIVAQGVEAGGHRGMFEPELGDPGIPTLDLVRALVREVNLPVIAAGGIMNGQGIAAALDAGAGAAQLGTAFILCPESAANEGYRSTLKGAGPGETQITAAISGRPARGIINRLHREVGASTAPSLPDYPIAYDAAKALHGAASGQDNHSFAAHWAGQGASLARELPASELMGVLIEETEGSERN